MEDIKIKIKLLFRSLNSVNDKIYSNYIKNNKIHKLNIGCGQNYLVGWLNTDIFTSSRNVFYLNAAKKFPFRNNTFDYIFSEHMIEHISLNSGMIMVTEIYRVLKTNGKVRISTPDIKFLVSLLLKKDKITNNYSNFFFSNKKYNGFDDAPAIIVNEFMRDHGHKFIYSKSVLKSLLLEAGFKDINYYNLNESNTPDFRGLENINRLPEGFLQFESFTIEGTKK